jgi:hypothetical protein
MTETRKAMKNQMEPDFYWEFRQRTIAIYIMLSL